MTAQTKKLRKLFSEDRIIMRMGVYDGFTAKLAEAAGFEFIGITGYGVSATFGWPDIGLVTMKEMVDRTKCIVDSVNIPVMADGDTGYGNALNVYRTVREIEAAGAAMIMLEDQVFPKKCGSMKGKQLISTQEMIGKIKAATDARKDSDFMLLARTDAVDVLGRDEALERAKKYEEAGADAILVMSPGSHDDMRRLNSLIKMPTFVTMAETEIWVRNNPLTSPEKLYELGYHCVSYPTTILYYAAQCVKDLLADINNGNKGLTEEHVSKMMHFKDVTGLLGLEKYYERENKYSIR